VGVKDLTSGKQESVSHDEVLAHLESLRASP